ncbi:MAG: alpha/beta hydrolase [Myxococcaceae bacterium]|nr:alpha/beta hydrolase [Myxococcaceae bacterium]
MKLILRLIAVLLALPLLAACAYIVVNWQPERSVAQLAPKWAPSPSRFLALDGMNVHLRDEGPRDDRSPIVLLHGTSASLHTWQGWTDVLKTQRRVIRLDLPGFGLTGPFPEDDYTLDHYVRFMTHFVDALGLSEFVLVGNSFGGNVAWHVAAALPQRVQRLILVDAGGYAYKPKSVPIGFRLAQIPGVRSIASRVLPRSLIESSVRNVYGDPSKVTPGLIDRYFELTLREGNRRALGKRFQQAVPGDDVRLVTGLELPTLILWGAKDQLIPRENGQRFRREIRGSQLVVLEGLGHVPQEEDALRSLAPVKVFLGLK